MLQLNDEAEAAIQETAGRLRGTLRVACSNAFGRKLLIPSLEQWQQRHPNIHIELLLSDQLAHLIEDRVDVAFRLAPLEESTLIARPIGTSRRILVASRKYIKRHGAIRDPSQLQRHQCIVFSGAERPRQWTFVGPKNDSCAHQRAPQGERQSSAIHRARKSGAEKFADDGARALVTNSRMLR